MKNKLKHYLKLGILLFGITLFLVNCQDEYFDKEIKNEIKISIKRIAINEIDNNKTILNKLEKLNTTKSEKNNNLSSREIYNSNYDFTIETDEALYAEYENYHSYTFRIIRENQSDLLENLLLSLQSDETYKAYIVSYDTTQEERENLSLGNTVDLEGKVSFRNIEFDTSFISSRGSWVGAAFNTCPDGECCDVGFEDTGCCIAVTLAIVPCGDGGGGSGGGSTGGDFPDDGNSGELPPDDSDSSGGGTGGSTSTDNTDTTCIADADGNCTTITSPIVDVGLSKECRKITNLFENYPNYKQKLIELDGKTEFPNEVAVGIYDDGSTFDIDGTCDGNEAKIELGTPPQKYRTLAHTHYENQNCNPKTTYSVFSMGDLQYLYTTYKQGKLSSNFVAFLVTGKGTKYALTISNTTKFSAFFNYLDATDFNGIYTTQQERIDAANNLNQDVLDLRKEYYTRDIGPLIDNTDTDNTNVLEQFLQFIKDGNIGLTVFESDDDFETFTRLKKKTNEIERTNCE